MGCEENDALAGWRHDTHRSSRWKSTSFLKKRSKRLLILRAFFCKEALLKKPKFFWFFFSKKNALALLRYQM